VTRAVGSRVARSAAGHHVADGGEGARFLRLQERLRAHRAVKHRLDEIAGSIEPPRLRHGNDLDIDEAGGGQRRPHALGLAELEEVGSVR